MQVTKGTWRMREQCVPGSLSSSPAQEPGNEANTSYTHTRHQRYVIDFSTLDWQQIQSTTMTILFVNTRSAAGLTMWTKSCGIINIAVKFISLRHCL